ncbi:hypothetical protein LTR95_016773 [Oleoguttula sp. CCFEE 5521]
MIKAGDRGHFDCGMFDCEYEGDASVSWRPVFEAYLRARVWAERLRQDDVQPGISVAGDLLRVRTHRHRSEADDSARYAVWLIKQTFEGRRMYGWKFTIEKYLQRIVGSSPETSVIRCPKISDIEHIEPQLLYYAWDVRTPVSTTIANGRKGKMSGLGHVENGVGPHLASPLIGPVLVHSAKPLPLQNLMVCQVNQEKTGLGLSHGRLSHMQAPAFWPAVDGSSESVAMYGQPTVHELATTSICDDRDHQTAPVAVVQGSPLLEVSADELAALSIILGVELQINKPYQPSGCGGFGCLLLSNMSRGIAMIRLLSQRTPKSTVRPKARNVHSTLFAKHMASGTYWVQAGCQLGKALRLPDECSWPSSVAHIAFGGLVPMAAEQLVDLVTYSLGSVLDSRDVDALDTRMIDAVDTQIKRRTGVKNLHLFRDRTERHVLARKTGIYLDSTSLMSHAFYSTTRDVMAQLALYTTLLEALIAMIDSGERASHRHGDDFLKHGRAQRDAVFKACAEQVRQAYVAKVFQAGYEHPTIATLIRSPLEELHRTNQLSPAACGTVSRCIIMAWTHFVRRIT